MAAFPIRSEIFFVPDGETPAGIIGEKLSLKELVPKFFRTGPNGLVSSLFLVALLLFFAEKETLAKHFLTELCKNLTVEVLSFDNSENLQFDALTDLCVELSVRLGNSIFANHERTRPDIKQQAEEISKKYDFFDDQDDKKDKKDLKIKSDTEIDDIETIPYASTKRENDIDDIETIPYTPAERENDIDDRETIVYASPRRESENKIDEKMYKEPKLETAAELKNKLQKEKKNLSKMNWKKTRLIF